MKGQPYVPHAVRACLWDTLEGIAYETGRFMGDGFDPYNSADHTYWLWLRAI